LRQTGLEFVHAPIRKPDGEVLTRLGDYAVSVFPFIDGIEGTYGGDGTSSPARSARKAARRHRCHSAGTCPARHADRAAQAALPRIARRPSFTVGDPSVRRARTAPPAEERG